MIWNRLGCDLCGMLGPALKGRPRATLLRRISAGIGWRRVEIENVVRDLCPSCSKLGRGEQVRLYQRKKPEPEPRKEKPKKAPPFRASQTTPGVEALLDDDDYFDDED